MGAEFTMRLTASDADTDQLGHVNNARWVEWIQQVAVAHWYADAPADYADRYMWVVIRHEIDYQAALAAHESVTGRTWIPDPPRGAKFDRHMEFLRDDGRVAVRAKTTWAMIDKASGRPARVPPEISAAFS